MTTKRKAFIAGLILTGFTIGHNWPRDPEISYETRTVVKERVKRHIVRITNPDGTIKETIDETENKDVKLKTALKITPYAPKWYIRASTRVSRRDDWQVGLGYHVLRNVAVEASYDRLGGSILVGVLIRF